MKLTNSHIRQLIAEERKRVVNEVPYSGRREDIPKTPPQPKKKKWSTPDAVDTTTPDTEFWHASPTKDLHYIRTIRINNREIEASAALDPMKREWGLTLNTPRGNPRNPIASAIISREIRTVEDIVRELEKGRPHAPSNLKSYEELWDRIYGRPVNEETMTKQQLEQIIKEELGKMLNEKPEGRPIVWGGGTSDAEANVAAINTMQKNWEDVKDDLRQRGITEEDVLLGYKTVWKTLPPKVTQDTVNSLKATYQFPPADPRGKEAGLSIHHGQKMAIEDLNAWLIEPKESPPWAGSIGA